MMDPSNSKITRHLRLSFWNADKSWYNVTILNTS